MTNAPKTPQDFTNLPYEEQKRLNIAFCEQVEASGCRCEACNKARAAMAPVIAAWLLPNAQMDEELRYRVAFAYAQMLMHALTTSGIGFGLAKGVTHHSEARH